MQVMSISESASSFGEALPRALPDITAEAASDLASLHYQPLYEAMDRHSPLTDAGSDVVWLRLQQT